MAYEEILTTSTGVPNTDAGGSALINKLTIGTSTPTDADYYIAQYVGGGTSTTSYHRRSHSALWTYIKGKADGVYQAKGSYAAASHTHNYAGSSSAGGAANSANALATARTIGLGTGATGTATSFNGTQNITIPVTEVKEAYLTWGGKNFSGTYGPIDAAMVPTLGANRSAFIKAAGVTIEYSTNGGTSWSDYGANNSQKILFFTNFGGGDFTIGKNSTIGAATSKYMLRVTVDTDAANIYSILNKFVIYAATNGSSGCYCTIEGATYGSPTSFTTFANKVSISGWPGYNVINTSGIITHGNQSFHYSKLRFTFGCTSANSSSYYGLTVYGIQCYGGVGWSTPSTLAKTGLIYSFDANQNVSFPAQVTATQFNGPATGMIDYNDSDGTKVLKIGYSGTGLDTSTCKYIAGYNNSGYIKNVSFDNVKSLLGLKVTVGSATQPIYFNNGTPTACTYTLGKSVPSNAKFTDTNTTYSAGTGLSLSGTVFSVKTGYTTSGKNYKVQADSFGDLFVNVPWTDTNTVTTATTTGSGNAVTAITASNGALTVTKGSTFLTTVSKANVTRALGYTPCRAWTVTVPSGSSGSKAIAVSGATFSKSPLIAKSSGSDDDYNKITAVSASTNTLTFTLSAATSAALTLMVIETF